MPAHPPVLVANDATSFALPDEIGLPAHGKAEPTSLSSAVAWVSDAVHSLEVDPLRNGLRLVVLGGVATAVKRGVDMLWDAVVDRLTLTAHIEQHDPAYDWMMAWLAQPELQHAARNFEVDTKTAQSRIGRKRDWDDEDVMLLPNFEHIRWISFEGTWMKIVRNKETVMAGNPSESITIVALSQHQRIIHHLLAAAQRAHAERDHSRIIIYTPAYRLQAWCQKTSRLPRSLDSVVLDKKTKHKLVRDVSEFLGNETWYADRGIPHRRGYLLHGPPGSGKTSLITAIAGTLGLNIYVISLAQRGLDDANLSQLVGSIPPGAIVLMEDIDCAFESRPVLQEFPDQFGAARQASAVPSSGMPTSSITLSGLLNCLDGVAAQEGSLFFATTNHVEVLDPALSRPGRLDVWVQFHQATQDQARDLFLNFYPPAKKSPDTPPPDAATSEKPSTEEADRLALADAFAALVPDGQYSVAALQGFLMTHKGDPAAAVAAFPAWTPPSAAKAGTLKWAPSIND